MSSNQIALYKKINEQLIENSGLFIEFKGLSYQSENETVKLNPLPDFDGMIVVNDYDNNWTPAENNLKVHSTLSIKDASVLFGSNGVTMPENTIGFAVHIHSKSSFFQKTLTIFEITSDMKDIKFDFNQTFNAGELNGQLSLDYFLYLKEYNNHYFKHANHSGMILTEFDLHNYMVIVDGDASSFPINEFEDKEGPLWKLEKHWVDAESDSFNSSNVCLSLNIKHYLFPQLKEGKTAISRTMMGDIMVQAMAMIITQVKNENCDLHSEEIIVEGSILSACQYWVKTFNVDTTDMFTITNSLRAYFSQSFLKGASEND
ncbi:hypothetical protein ERX27_02475 [Macrococcus brunensis]|uniref:Uncharacterized protein n=1 Tax=Macrococcus brunensis TaxID=198483 RepID=A0A4R6BFK9_9STAP|nr:hypothetical protein [Macrococcus brunensis]TDL98661.1 hypothetical protein ERX27_02475 [Macrococcus brunensis]